MLGTLLEHGLSFIKSLLIASYYGTSGELDAYFLALAPFRLVSGVLFGATQAVLIPRYLELKEKKGQSYAFSVVLVFSGWMLLLVVMVSVGFFGGSSWLARYLGLGFDENRLMVLASLLKVVAFLLCISFIGRLGLYLFHAHRQFVVPALVPVSAGVFSLLYIAYFHRQGVSSLLFALVGGMTLQTCITLYAARQFWPRHVSVISPVASEICAIGKSTIPMFLGASFGLVNVTVDQMMASTLPEGSIAALNYASKLHSIPTQMFIMVVSGAVLPFFARQAAEHDFAVLRSTFFLTIRRILYILLPVTLGILLFGEDCVRVVFQRGSFSADSTSATSAAWIAYTFGLPMQAIGIITARMYNALQEHHILMYVAGGSIGLNIVFNVVFMKFWGHVGIALSTSGLSWVTTTILLYMLYRKTDKFWSDSQ